MAASFALYSTDADPVTSPTSASFYVIFDDVPWEQGIDAFAGTYGRGSVHQTLGGAVIQDFGVKDADRLISFGGTDALRPATVQSIDSAYRTVDGRFFFSDGYDVWRVAFSRNPAGFKAYRNYKYSQFNVPFFSYEINLIVIEKVA